MKGFLKFGYMCVRVCAGARGGGKRGSKIEGACALPPCPLNTVGGGSRMEGACGLASCLLWIGGIGLSG